jgi:hypothetical protein
MSNIIIAGFTTEGSTDVRFLKSVIQRTFEDVAGECNSDIEVHDIQYIPTGKGSFREEILKAAIHADEIGVMVLCVHTDADAEDDNRAFEDRINPAFSYVSEHENGACKNLVAIVPIQMTEAWMLADKELFKEEIYTQRSNRNLGIEEPPEKITDPKAAIKTAIRIAFEDRPRRRQKPDINELYLPLGQKIGLHQLSKLPSYQKFKDGVRGAFHTLNFLQ